MADRLAGSMTAPELRAFCLALAGAVEEFPFRPEVSVFKVAGKIFAIAHLTDDPVRISLKCEPELAESLRVTHPAITPGYHLNKRHWNTIVLDGTVPDELLGELIEDSYDLIVAALPQARRPG
jgi:predicted DNA-binding protein (MmcQ/YjbR family)